MNTTLLATPNAQVKAADPPKAGTSGLEPVVSRGISLNMLLPDNVGVNTPTRRRSKPTCLLPPILPA